MSRVQCKGCKKTMSALAFNKHALECVPALPFKGESFASYKARVAKMKNAPRQVSVEALKAGDVVVFFHEKWQRKVRAIVLGSASNPGAAGGVHVNTRLLRQRQDDPEDWNTILASHTSTGPADPVEVVGYDPETAEQLLR